MTKEEMKNFRVTAKDIPVLMEILGAAPEWIAELDELDKMELAEQANQIIAKHLRS